MSGRVIVVVGGQFGSEGKGAVAAHLARREPHPLMAMRIAGPNAGHTVIGTDDKEYKFRCIPVAAVVRPDAMLAIGAGSEIDHEVLAEEIGWGEFGDRLFVDAEATVIQDEHKERERSIKTGTTGKGIGAARADRLMRQAEVYGGEVDTAQMAGQWLHSGGTLMIEGTQGFGLGLHSGYYPHTTSSDCRAIDFLAMAGISPWADYVAEVEVWVVLRTYPIRIAGESGPMTDETSWANLASESNDYIVEERTTVTNKVRRVGRWDLPLAQAAVECNGGASRVKIAMTFADYIDPNLADTRAFHQLNQSRAWKIWAQSNMPWDLRNRVRLVGTGQNSVVEVNGAN